MRSFNFDLLYFWSPFRYRVLQYLIGKLLDMVKMIQEGKDLLTCIWTSWKVGIYYINGRCWFSIWHHCTYYVLSAPKNLFALHKIDKPYSLKLQNMIQMMLHHNFGSCSHQYLMFLCIHSYSTQHSTRLISDELHELFINTSLELLRHI